jgi:23S rRNA (cytosine1962-C5)-methyltransferase
VAARLGGAARAVNLDLSRKVLDWGEANLRHNGVAPERFDFIAGDTFEWLGRFARKGEQFDLVVLDPPGFAGAGKRRFSAQGDYHALVSAAAGVLAPGGQLLAMCNVEALSLRDFEAHVVRGFAARRSKQVASFSASDTDFRQPAALKCLVYEA